jgi:hypothetical protein
MSTQTIQSVDATSCPETTILLTGIADTELINLSSDITEYSDGYKAKITATLNANSIPTAVGTYGICVGTELSVATTSETGSVTEAVNGAYCLVWTASGSAPFSERTNATDIAGYWMKPAAWTVMATDNEWLLNLEQDMSALGKYDLEILPVFDANTNTVEFVSGANLSMAFYMPSKD